jgi:signal peptidase I
MPAFLHGAFAAGAAIPALAGCAKLWRDDELISHGVAALGAVALAYTCYHANWNPRAFVPTARDVESGDRLIHRLAALDGDVWMPSHPWYLVLAGKTPHVHRMGIKDVTARQPRTVVGLDDAVEPKSNLVMPPDATGTGEQAASPNRIGSGPGNGGGDGSGTLGSGGAAGHKPHGRASRAAIEWGILIVAALVIAIVIRTFVFQAFYIPSESMVPTLKIGDRVLVNKLSYDLHEVHRGDIIVFKAPKAAQSGDIADLVKRVIGLPGDTVEAREDGHVYVNDRLLDEPYLPAGTRTTNLPPTKIPAGHMFMMGDNREASKDSRVFGAVAESSIIGRVFVRIWPPGSIGLM